MKTKCLLFWPVTMKYSFFDRNNINWLANGNSLFYRWKSRICLLSEWYIVFHTLCLITVDLSRDYTYFTISVYGSSCNYLFFGPYISSFLSWSISSRPALGMQWDRREFKDERMRPRKRYLLKLLYTEIVNTRSQVSALVYYKKCIAII